MIQQALRFARILAGSDRAPADTAALRSGLIATFQKEPAKEAEGYRALATIFREKLSRKPTWLDLALIRLNFWQHYAQNPQDFSEFQSYPFGRMVLKYNPVLANSGGMIVTKTDVDCQFYSDALVATVAGVAPPTQAEKERFMRDLSSKFASMPRQQQEYLRDAEVRLVDVNMVDAGTIQTDAAIIADIRKNVRSPGDVWREARQVENDSQYGAKYRRLYESEMQAAILHATRVNGQIVGLGAALQNMMRNSDINRSVMSLPTYPW